jgi:hypothetical protein
MKAIYRAVCSEYCDHADDAVYSKERPIPLAGQEARRLEHDRQAGVPDPGATACFCQAEPHGGRSLDLESDAHRVATAPSGSSGITPGPRQVIRNGIAVGICGGTAVPAPEMALGQRRRR